jgi:DNA modification methylase
MKSIPDKSIDLVLTDPPYGAGRDFANDDETPIELLREVFNECYRVCKDDCFLMHDWARQKVLDIASFSGKWKFLDLLAVSQENTMAFCRVGFDVFQIKCLYGKGKPKVIRRGWNLYKTARVAKKEKFLHPTMKQVDVYRKQIVQFSKEGDTILDPFMGSGTTGVAAVKLDRHFIGIEIDEKYFNIAKKRIEEEQNKLKLF